MAELTTYPTPPRAAGRVLPGWLSALVVVERFWIWYRHGWRATAVTSVLQPLLFLLAFGVGLGSLVNTGGRAIAATGGVPYLMYLAPGLLAMSAVQIAAFESTYPVLSAFKWQRIYQAMAASPITPGQIAIGNLAWIGLRMLSSGVVYVLIIALLGGVRGFGVVLSLLCATLCGLAFSALVMTFASVIRNEEVAFSAFFRFVLIPMTLFSGTLFPITRLPAWVRPVAWVTPLWHGTELSRGVALGTLRLLPALGHLGYLLALLALGAGLLKRRFQRRLST